MGRYQSGQMELAVNQLAFGLRGFDSLPTHKKAWNIKHAYRKSNLSLWKRIVDLFMKEQFSENFGERNISVGENARFDAHSIHEGISNGLPGRHD